MFKSEPVDLQTLGIALKKWRGSFKAVKNHPIARFGSSGQAKAACRVGSSTESTSIWRGAGKQRKRPFGKRSEQGASGSNVCSQTDIIHRLLRTCIARVPGDPADVG